MAANVLILVENRGDDAMDQMELVGFADRFMEAWNSQVVERVVSFYTEDLRYQDPNTRGVILGAEALRRYLRKLFSAWAMHWTFRDGYPIVGQEGAVLLWHATFRHMHMEGTDAVDADGMDLVLLRGGKIVRNDVYFDRTILLQLSPPEQK